MTNYKQFKEDCRREIKEQGTDQQLLSLSLNWLKKANARRYSYHYEWMGRPIIQYPQDIAAMQEIIWEVRPNLIIETGIAHGGSLIFSASMLALLDLCEAIEKGQKINPAKSKRKVLAVDINIRAHNRAAIQRHPMSSRIQMIQGSSIAPDVITKIKAIAVNYSRILVCLDSNHTNEHVIKELEAYAPLVSKGSYCVVFDTIINDLPKKMFINRNWGPKNNPKIAVRKYLRANKKFVIDKCINRKLLITVAPDGYLKRIA